MHPRLIISAFLLVLASLVAAQDAAGTDGDIDQLFQDPKDVETDTAAKVELEQISASNGVKLTGGVLAQAGVIGGVKSWASLPAQPDMAASAFYKMSANLGFDARPDKDFRVYGNVGAEVPAAADSLSFSTANINELFFDLTLADTVLVRAGKQKLTLGQGTVNLLAGQTDDLTLKVSMPVLGWNLSGIMIARNENMPGGLEDYQGLLYAGSLEGSLGPWSMGILAMNQRYLRPVAQIYAKTSLAGVDTLVSGVFALRPDATIAPKALVGLFWEGLGPKLRVTLDWEFNGETPGYRDHTIALLAYMPSLPGTNMRPGLSWAHSFQDNSGSARIGVEITPLAHVKLILGVPVVYGDPGTRYMNSNSDPVRRVLAGAFAVEISGGF